MSPEFLAAIEARCEAHVAGLDGCDAAHDLQHIKRVVKTARYLTEKEQCNIAVTIPAAWLHDCVQVSKDSPDRGRVSLRAAEAATEFLRACDYPESLLDEVHHAIAAHSFSAGIPVRTPEAAVVQDADRLDALGSIGIARCLLTGAALGSELYHPEDPLTRQRDPDDRAYMIDHFEAKLLRLPETMRTEAGRREARRRLRVMQAFLQELEREVGGG